MGGIPEELTRAAGGAFTVVLPLDLRLPHRFILLSDQHKGAADGADEFAGCKPAYMAALNHYIAAGFTLILVGDVEELWEQGFRSVRRAHEDALRLEGSFPPGRYYRLWGNHDDEWMIDRLVRRRLTPYMPTQSVYEAMRFEVTDGGTHLGMLLILHGHQGSFASDKLRPIARLLLRGYRYLQRWFGIGKTTPATDACLRGEHDRELYDWASKQRKLVLIAGHTHRPVWSSRTHLQKLEAELEALERGPDTPQRQERIAGKRREIDERRRKYPPCEDTIKRVPCYFNTGCCKFEDGDITGIELQDGAIRLVKWWSTPAPGRTVLEEAQVAAIFNQLP